MRKIKIFCIALLLSLGIFSSLKVTKAETDYSDGLDWDSVIEPNPGYSSWSTIPSGNDGEISITLYNKAYVTEWSSAYSTTAPSLWYKTGLQYRPTYWSAFYVDGHEDNFGRRVGVGGNTYNGLANAYGTAFTNNPTSQYYQVGAWLGKMNYSGYSWRDYYRPNGVACTEVQNNQSSSFEYKAYYAVFGENGLDPNNPLKRYKITTWSQERWVAGTDGWYVSNHSGWCNDVGVGSTPCARTSGGGSTAMFYAAVSTSDKKTGVDGKGSWSLSSKDIPSGAEFISEETRNIYYSPKTWSNPISSTQFESYKSGWSKEVPSTCRISDKYCSTDSKLVSVTLYSYPYSNNPVLVLEDAYYYKNDDVSKADLLKNVTAYDASGKLDNVEIVSISYNDGTNDYSVSKLNTSKVQNAKIVYSVTNSKGYTATAAGTIHILNSLNESNTVNIYDRYYSCEYYDYLKNAYTNTNPSDAEYHTIYKEEEYLNKMKDVCEATESALNKNVRNRNVDYNFVVTYDLRLDDLSPVNTTVQYNANVLNNAPDVPTREGLVFKRWLDESGNIVTENTRATKSQTYSVDWEVTEYTITYDLDGGALPEGKTNPTTYTTLTDTFTIVNPTKENYIFNGWKSEELSIENEMNLSINKGVVNKNIKLTAQWKEAAAECCDLVEQNISNIDALNTNINTQTTSISELTTAVNKWYSE